MHAFAVILFHLVKDKISLPKVVSWFITFMYVSIAWVFFRSPDTQTGFDFLSRLFYIDAWDVRVSMYELFIFVCLASLLLLHYLESLFMKVDFDYRSFIFNSKVSYLTWGLIFILILIISPSGMPPFIYFSY